MLGDSDILACSQPGKGTPVTVVTPCPPSSRYLGTVRASVYASYKYPTNDGQMVHHNLKCKLYIKNALGLGSKFLYSTHQRHPFLQGQYTALLISFG